MLLELVALVRRDGVRTVRRRLLHDRYGWSVIDHSYDSARHEMRFGGRPDPRLVMEEAMDVPTQPRRTHQ